MISCAARSATHAPAGAHVRLIDRQPGSQARPGGNEQLAAGNFDVRESARLTNDVKQFCRRAAIPASASPPAVPVPVPESAQKRKDALTSPFFPGPLFLGRCG
jgi:hypothetical protein